MNWATKLCDLHTHSVYSDGTWTPREIVAEAARLGIAVALTDHNTVSGLPEFMAAAEEMGVEAVPGAEFSAQCFGKEMHVLALFLRPESYGTVAEFTEEIRRKKAESNREMVSRMNADGYAVDLDALSASTPDGYVNRAHIAEELVRLGYTESIDEAFGTLLHPLGKYYTPLPKPEALDVIEFIKRLGALPILAHPYLKFTAEELDSFIPEAKRRGLVGMETVYSLYDSATEKEATETAKRHELLMSGGSDFHGDRKPDIGLAVGKGDLCVPYELFMKLFLKNISAFSE